MVSTIGSEVRLDCQFYGEPAPTISWAKDSYVLWSSSRVHVDRGSVVLREMVASDAGLYQCWAESDAGIEYTVIRLVVAPLHATVLPTVPLGEQL